MKNLFVLHTQYNIILGTGIMLNDFRDCQNDLVIYAEFPVSYELKSNLESLFDNVLFIREKYEPLKVGLINIEKELASQWHIYKHSHCYGVVYDNVFISQDRALEALIVGRCRKNNRNCKFWDVEEDCYYSIDPIMNDPNYNPGWHTRRIWVIRKLIYGSLYVTNKKKGTYIYGQSSYFDGIYALFPELIRPQLSHLEKLLITKECIVQACNSLYSGTEISMPNSSKYYLFFFDLLKRYRNPDVIKNIVVDIVEKARIEGSVVLLKYHPRETQKFEFAQDGIFEIPFTIPAEKLLCDLYEKNVTVFGNATTAVIVAAKLGFKTMSVAEIEGTGNNYMINKFKEMGIVMPLSIEDII